MMSDALVRVLQESLYLALLLAAPPLAAVFGTGLVMGLLQSATRVEDRTLSSVPKLVAAFVALGLAGPWIGAELVRFTTALLEAVPTVGRT